MQVSLSSPVRAPARPGDGAGERLATGSLLLPLACLGLALLAFAGTVLGWILTHPEVGGWDQIGYGDEALRDLVALARGGLGALRDSLFLEARHHPPGHRLLALPLGLAGHADMTTLRFMAFGFSLLTAAVVGLVARRAAGTSAGLLAAAAFLMAPVSLFAAEEFLSETLLLPALAGLLWCLAREATGEGGWGNALLLGACLGAGALARLSFIPQVAPVLLAGLAVMLAGDRARLPRMLLAGTVAALIAWPFYAINGGRYIGYARFALTEWHSHQVKNDSPIGYLGNWLWFVADWAFGPFLAVALAGGALAALVLVGRAAWQARPRAAAGAGPGAGRTRPSASPPLRCCWRRRRSPDISWRPTTTRASCWPRCRGWRSPWRSGCTGSPGAAAGRPASGSPWAWSRPRRWRWRWWPAGRPRRPRRADLHAVPPGARLRLAAAGGAAAGRRAEAAAARPARRLQRGAGRLRLPPAAAGGDHGEPAQPGALGQDRGGGGQGRPRGGAAGRRHAGHSLLPRELPPDPGGSEQRMNLVSEALLDRLGTEAGFTHRQAIEAPGGGGCRAVLLSR
ncbi:glycosyltransferase family 39 protein [Paeniroseomonas aquatica]|uniref:glycosyltransferase family 39 protein n=1 Tax=Paeniroseomonas aquatica TaxID=373043 RepID=UPI00361AB8D4